MVFTINTNIDALKIQRSMAAAQNAGDIAMQRLSSGLRINGANDDPAGLAISDRMTSIVRGQTVAVDNANDAISFAQTADAALSSLTDTLQRMRDLAVESANFTNSATDRQALNTEFTGLQGLITQLTNTTLFNNQNPFDGAARVFQIGYGVSADNRITFQGTDLTSDTSYTGLAAFINNGVSQATVDNAASAFIAGGGTFNPTDGSPLGAGAAALNATTSAFANNVDAADQTTFNNAKTAFTNAGGSFNAGNGNPVAAKSGTTTVVISPGPPPVTQQVPVSTPADINTYNTFTAAQTAYYASAKGLEILDQPSALSAISGIDNALHEIETEKSQLGGFENRLNSIVADLRDSIINQSAARGRIMDADYAVETSNLSRGQILRHAEAAMLAQANQMPDGVLSLLR